MLYTILIILAAIGVDQLTKYFAVTYLADGPSHPVIENILHFTYVQNEGAAFGMLKNHRWIFMLLSAAAILGLLIWIFRDKSMDPWYRCATALIIGGGIGNMIDRILLGYVIDFIDVTCIDFYVFNVADACVCVGCGMFLIGILASEIKEAKKKKALANSSAEGDDNGGAQ